MKLKRKITKLDEVDEKYRGLYKQEGDAYVLDVDGIEGDTGGEDLGALKRAKDHEKEQRKAAELRARELEAELDELRDGASRKSGDVAALEESWKAKLAKREGELQSQIDALSGNLQTILVDNVAQSLAAEISSAPKVIMPHIRSRLKAELVDGKAVTKVLDAEGKASASTLDELKSEFVNNKEFASIIVGSKASGGGASGGQGGGGAPAKPDFSKASPKEIAGYLKSQSSGG